MEIDGERRRSYGGCVLLFVLVLAVLALAVGSCLVFNLNSEFRSHPPPTLPSTVVNYDVAPDEKSIAFTTTKGELWFYDVDSGKTTFIAAAKFDNSVTPDRLAFSPDGKRIALSVEHPTHGVHCIYLVDTASRTLKQLTYEPSAEDRDPSWTLDGKRLLFVRELPSDRNAPSGGTKRQLMLQEATELNGRSQTIPMKRGCAEPSQMAADSRIVFQEWWKGKSMLKALPANGKGTPKLLFAPPTGVMRAFGLSSDGKRVAYVAEVEGNEPAFTMCEVGGHIAKALPNVKVHYVFARIKFSKDNKSVFLLCEESPGTTNNPPQLSICKVSPNGSKTQLVAPGVLEGPSIHKGTN